ncbi:hypothetical protein RHODO2019_10875 [Rhodococcus antarcticus]|uniref:Head-to-tail adaptor n=1 Tax=Rhodococcus antarcticus TaxID=2987751 RepID=A0ABY6NXG1_9NOCA|nr:hypothetical protein [Rhodococcus antarcticus]UZJ23711.1 hypothetical protein RHODO2019_10875 [Rhodococcus antarcticus]
MYDPLASLDELTARLDWKLDEDEIAAAPGYLEEASDLARMYGSPWPDPDTAPRLVKSLVIASVRRFMRNPEGYTQSRAGDETLAWSDLGHEAGSIYFNEREIKLLKGLSNRSTITTAPTVAWGPVKRGNQNLYVPVSYVGGKSFPFLTDDGASSGGTW